MPRDTRRHRPAAIGAGSVFDLSGQATLGALRRAAGDATEETAWEPARARFGPDPVDYPRAKARARGLSYIHSLGYPTQGQLAQGFADAYADYAVTAVLTADVDDHLPLEPGEAAQHGLVSTDGPTRPPHPALPPLWSVLFEFVLDPSTLGVLAFRGDSPAAAADRARAAAAPHVIRVLQVTPATPPGPLRRLLYRLLAR